MIQNIPNLLLYTIDRGYYYPFNSLISALGTLLLETVSPRSLKDRHCVSSATTTHCWLTDLQDDASHAKHVEDTNEVLSFVQEDFTEMLEKSYKVILGLTLPSTSLDA